MKKIDLRLRQFERRVRLVRGWRGLAYGLCVGALGCLVWALLDWAGRVYAEWSGLGVLFGVCGLLGFVIGLLMPVSRKGLSDSIDRRAGLEDRLMTSLEVAESQGGFEQALHEDAEARVTALKPARLYPVKMGRWQAIAALLGVVAASVFLLGNTPILLSREAKKDREELKQLGQAVERVAKPLLEDAKQGTLTPDQQRLAEELRKFNRDLEKAHIDKKEAMQKANELEKEAERLTQEKAKQTDQNLADVETAFDKLKKEELAKAGLDKLDPNLAQMTDAERDAQAQNLQSQLDKANAQLNSLQQQLQNANLTPEERKALEQQKQMAEKASSEAKKGLEQLKLSKEAQDLIRRIMENPIYKEMQEMAKKLAKATSEAKAGKKPSLTHEQIKEMERRLDELAKRLKGDKALDEYLRAMLESMKNACGT